ncbi:pullulanase [bacterium]|nr:pullulanase [bacterium]
MNIIYAKIQKPDTLEVHIHPASASMDPSSFIIEPRIDIFEVSRHEEVFTLRTSPFNLTQSYTLKIGDSGEKKIQPDGVLDLFYSRKSLGYRVENGIHIFRLFAPRAKWVKLVFFENYYEHCDAQIDMIKDEEGVWEVKVDNLKSYRYYGYRVEGPDDETEMFDSSEVLADPYSRAVVTKNHFMHPAKTLLFPPGDFDWEGDIWMKIPPEDLIIYEMHVRDMTLHPSSEIQDALRGTYLGLTSLEGRGGLNHLLELGVNCVELMPVQEFGNIEVDYKNEDLDILNDWNAYERNHWGYMTSYFFAPESYYATGGTMSPNAYMGQDGRAVTELKTLVKTLHHQGIAVIMDVVYNHVSQYDLNPLKFVDKKYYFRLDNDQNLTTASGCGNDFKTERPMSRKLILDSLIYWMTEYHIDGFRFDLATMIDYDTLKTLTKVLRKVNPDVVLIAEPWGRGKYDLQGFSQLGWGAWNDLFRNSVKGDNPNDGLGLIFGRLWRNVTPEYIKNIFFGSVKNGGGPFLKVSHAVNYLESHDDYSLGDFIRIGLNETDPSRPVDDLDAHSRLSETQLKYNKMAALILLTSRGSVMIHSGQEFGRSKVIAPTKLPDTYPGFIDHNSYNKDDETNWINYAHMKMNQELVNYYSGLIALRRKFPVFRKPSACKNVFFETHDPLIFAYCLTDPDCGYSMMVLLNCNQREEFTLSLPEGFWNVMADEQLAGEDPLYRLNSDRVTLAPGTGKVILKT